MKRFTWIFLFFISPLFSKDVVLITGATQGLGLLTAIKFAQEDYQVYASWRQSSNKKELIEASAIYPNIIPIEIDVTDEKLVNQAIDTVISQEGKIDVVINNAGVLLWGAMENTSIEDAKWLFEANFFGVMRTLHAVLPHMREQKNGRIINVSSRAGFRPVPSLSLYSASKWAIEAISETLAFNLKPFNIKVSTIQPGPLNTEMDANGRKSDNLDDDPYLSYFEELGLTMDDSVSNAQDTQEVADLIYAVAQEDAPHLRYQGDEIASKLAHERLKDPTGDVALRQMLKGFGK